MPAAALDLDTTLFIPLLDQALGADLGEVTKEVERLSAELVRFPSPPTLPCPHLSSSKVADPRLCRSLLCE